MVNDKQPHFKPNQLHVNTFYIRIERWYDSMLEKCREELPDEEYKIAKASLDKFLKVARVLRTDCDMAIEQHWAQTVWFVLPWRVLLWYSVMKKK